MNKEYISCYDPVQSIVHVYIYRVMNQMIKYNTNHKSTNTHSMYR